MRGIVYALIGALLFSLKPILIKLAYQYGGDATSIMTLRAFSSLPVYLVMLVWLCKSAEARGKVRQYGWQAALVGVLGYYLASFLDIVALDYISAQLERLLIFLFPSLVVLITWLKSGQKPTQATVKAVAIGYGGIALIVAHDVTSMGSKVWVGSALAIASALVFACYLILSKGYIAKMGSQLFTSIGMGSAGIAILCHLLLSDTQLSEWSYSLVILGITLGIFCTVIPSYFMAAAMAELSPTQFSLTANIGPVITAVAAVLVLGEVFTLYHGVGMVLVVYSVYCINKK
ncbi:EamA/RhaT family transporter [Photobacterium sanctipauli]|uniref:EamA/RhaT family transporter n=1 Tax=Photobacterium sanctipauli TaxID=1342794 RepID=A0A2T3NZ51_9GAMM|nr:DMT family transporter [Photobacterium sanctipauli]PSW21551.1 EamA/RhaT family transporter [Photobacterium sanctipauli]